MTLDHPLSTKVSISRCLIILSECHLCIIKKTAIAVCESDTDASTDPKDVPHSILTDGVSQSEKTCLLSPHFGGNTPTNAYPETDGIRQ